MGTQVNIKASELRAYRHSIEVEHGDGKPSYWCPVVVIAWMEDLANVRVMFENHCFAKFKADEIITVSVNESHIGDGLPNKQEAWQKYYDVANKRLKEAESTLEERKRIVAALLQVNPKVSHVDSLKQVFYGNRDWLINLDDPPQ